MGGGTALGKVSVVAKFEISVLGHIKQSLSSLNVVLAKIKLGGELLDLLIHFGSSDFLGIFGIS